MTDPDALSRVTIDPALLEQYAERKSTGSGRTRTALSWAERAHALLLHQRETWPLLRRGYDGLDMQLTRQFWFDGYEVRTQYNPGRITSSAAKVDEHSIRERKCFLCLHNLPSEQRGIPYGDRYILLANPFPILAEHFTIPRVDHVPQRIDAEFEVMLDLARDFSPGYTVFYNGPRCGASAPDHLHFQAGIRWSMPVESEYGRLKSERGALVEKSREVQSIAIDGGERCFLSLEGTDPGALHHALRRYLAALQGIRAESEEPMVNIIAWYDAAGWTVLVYPRVKHRPSFFFAEGEERILISPAVVDLGGVVAVPLETDFHKMTREHLLTMYHEVQLSRPDFNVSIERFRST